MTLRKANDRTLRRRIFGFALRSSLAAVVATSVTTSVSAQQHGTALVLPALPTSAHSQCDASGGSCGSVDTLQARRERLVQLLGLRDQQRVVHRATALPALPVLPTDSVEQTAALPAFPNFDDSVEVKLPTQAQLPVAAAISTKVEVNHRTTVQPVVWQQPTPEASVQTAAATESVTTRVTDAGSEKVTVTITGDQPSDESFDSIEIPMSLSLEASAPSNLPSPATPQATLPPAPAQLPAIGLAAPALPPLPPATQQESSLTTEQTTVTETTKKQAVRQVKPRIRAPQIVASGPAMQLSSSTEQEDASTAEFSLSDANLDSLVKTDTVTAKSSTAKTPTPSMAQTKPQKQSAPMLRPVEASALPSTSSSRGGAIKVTGNAGGLAKSESTTSSTMQVRIDGETPKATTQSVPLALKPMSSEPKTLAPSPTAPPPLSLASQAPKRFALRDAQSVTKSKTGVKASLTSSSKSLPDLNFTDDSTKVSSRHGSESTVQAPSYEITSRVKVVAEQSSPIQVREAILQTSVEDPSICRLIQSGDTGLSVVGLKAGTTRVAVVTAGKFGEPKVNVHEVSVGHGHQARIGLTELAAGIDETINRLYPTSDIRVSAGEGKLVVAGEASSESEAKRVLGLVRRTSLLPVVDRLDVR